MLYPSPLGAETSALEVIQRRLEWIKASQSFADLYHLGIKIWLQEDFVDIERQLKQSQHARKFVFRRMDGSELHIPNPTFGCKMPTWKPYIKLQGYWCLVIIGYTWSPDPATYGCPYILDWRSLALDTYISSVGIPNLSPVFERDQQLWNQSTTCADFTWHLLHILHGLNPSTVDKKITKIVCFGLGDLYKSQTAEKGTINRASIHHAVALTIAEVASDCPETGGAKVRLLAQDPSYCDETKTLLRGIGFEIVGERGAAGFAEIDDESIVFSAFTTAPVKQIIADLARPVAIICSQPEGIFKNRWYQPRKPCEYEYRLIIYPLRRDLNPDPESPRTKEMWRDYDSWDFPTHNEIVSVQASLDKLRIYFKGHMEERGRPRGNGTGFCGLKSKTFSYNSVKRRRSGS